MSENIGPSEGESAEHEGLIEKVRDSISFIDDSYNNLIPSLARGEYYALKTFEGSPEYQKYLELSGAIKDAMAENSLETSDIENFLNIRSKQDEWTENTLIELEVLASKINQVAIALLMKGHNPAKLFGVDMRAVAAKRIKDRSQGETN